MNHLKKLRRMVDRLDREAVETVFNASLERCVDESWANSAWHYWHEEDYEVVGERDHAFALDCAAWGAVDIRAERREQKKKLRLARKGKTA